ncbi:MAG: NAD(P)H-hydrate dehydratase [Desulfurococcales archaeon]|nr:NAD(P)H-hydrate dehydratase [Desulfurococcales archaeon]
MKVSTVAEMHGMDETAVEEYGISHMQLMENAGHAVYFVILQHHGDLKGKKFVVFAGPGNNGGDSLVVTRKLYSMGASVKVFLLTDPSKYKGPARDNFEIVKKTGVDIQDFDYNTAENALIEADAVIDGIFGTGLSREVDGIYAEAIDLINKSGKPVFSIDIPSGISGDTGKVMGKAVRANYTVTFGLPKIGNILYPGYEYCGEVIVSHISFPPAIYENSRLLIELNDPIKLPPRKKDGHKGSFGEALFIAGARKYYGAPLLSALSFLKAGGGYSRLATPSSVAPFIGTSAREVVFHPLPETDDGSISYSAREEILNLAKNVDIVVLGPGTSLNNETQKLILELIPAIEKPLIVDGDGLTALSRNPSIVKERVNGTILTPHPGEMARLTGLDIASIIEDRVGVARKYAMEYNSIIVLKGAHTQIAMPDGKVYINMSGNSGMATAGSGDVLTGAIAAMYGLGLSLEEAARMGVFLHGFAGDLAAEARGEDGIVARDIMEHLPLALKLLRTSFESIKNKYSIRVV